MDNNKPTSEAPKKVNQKKPARRKRGVLFVTLNLVIVALILAGVYLIFEPMYVHWQQDRASDELMDAFENGDGTIVVDINDYMLPGEEPEIVETTEETTTITTTGAPTTVETTQETTTTTTTAPKQEVVIQAIGRIKIPSINVDMPISEGATNTTLRVAIGHWIWSVDPGQDGLAIYLGHRMYTYGRHFNRLGEMVVGNKIIIETKDTRYTYEVDRIDVVEPDELTYEFQAPVEGKRIMLVTCTPIRVASHRLLVKGVLIKTESLK